ncbi:MAG: hypothetical protein E6R08_06320 [Nevskiaceae bacterium]|nr:MAG: hypothetical protein E6R08_06320 [Nevskiaceae bacterium]
MKKRPLVAKSLSELRDLITQSQFQTTPEEDARAERFFASADITSHIINRSSRRIGWEIRVPALGDMPIVPMEDFDPEVAEKFRAHVQGILMGAQSPRPLREWWAGKLLDDGRVEVTMTDTEGGEQVAIMEYDSLEYQTLLKLGKSRTSPFIVVKEKQS